MIRPAANRYASRLTPPLTFSVAVPIRDHVEFLDSALRSIEMQHVPVEIAALDASDGDRAQDILAARRVGVAYGYHRRDEGQAAAIHDGWAHTSGEIVAWLNADDVYFPRALDRVAAVFHARPEVDLVHGHAVYMSADGDFLGYFPSIDVNPQSLLRGCSICQPSCFVRRRAVERVGGLNTTLHYTMDWDLWLRLFRAGCGFAFVDAPLSAVRIHAATKTMSRASARYREIDALLKRAGASALGRVRALAGFYGYDLQQRRSSAFEHAVHGVLSSFARVRRRVRARSARVQGIECWTNVVRGDCRVELPWFGAGVDAAIDVVSDRPIDLAFTSGSRSGTLIGEGPAQVFHDGEHVSGYRYVGRVPITDGTISVALSAGTAAWRLLRMSGR